METNHGQTIPRCKHFKCIFSLLHLLICTLPITVGYVHRDKTCFFLYIRFTFYINYSSGFWWRENKITGKCYKHNSSFVYINKRPYLVLNLNLISISPCKLAIYNSSVNRWFQQCQQCKSATYSSVNRQFTVNERPVAENDNPSGFKVISLLVGFLWCATFMEVIYYFSRKTVNLDAWIGCKFTYFLYYFCIHYSSALLVIMSVEKCLALYFPFKTKSICTVKIAKRVTLVTAIIFVVFDS